MADLSMDINMTPAAASTMAACIAAAVAAQMEKHFTVEPTLTLAEAAKSIGVSVTVMRQLCRERKIPAIKLDKFYRIRVIDINRFLEDRLIDANTGRNEGEGVSHD